ncbi:uncharacterized protein METZ01_LOCUS68659 [marine metagenome]|uniref:Uncharacterized protein n=1 Tax=marine metagenome TaxID=408172 RepID=A0A381TI61_9ZZZZ
MVGKEETSGFLVYGAFFVPTIVVTDLGVEPRTY